MSALTEAFNRAGGGETALQMAAKSGRVDILEQLLKAGARVTPDTDSPDAFKDNQADGFKADPPLESAGDDQADGYKGPADDDAITVMRPLQLKRAKKKIVL
jgi:hypothetical protein